MKLGVDGSSKPITKIRRQIGQSTLARALCTATSRSLRLVSEQPCTNVTLGISDWPHSCLWDRSETLTSPTGMGQDKSGVTSLRDERKKSRHHLHPAWAWFSFRWNIRHRQSRTTEALLCQPPLVLNPIPRDNGNWGLLLSDGPCPHIPSHVTWQCQRERS